MFSKIAEKQKGLAERKEILARSMYRTKDLIRKPASLKVPKRNVAQFEIEVESLKNELQRLRG